MPDIVKPNTVADYATTLNTLRGRLDALDAQLVALRREQIDVRGKRQALQVVWDDTLSAMLALDKPGVDVFAPSLVVAPVVASPAPVAAPLDKPTTKPRK